MKRPASHDNDIFLVAQIAAAIFVICLAVRSHVQATMAVLSRFTDASTPTQTDN